MCINILHTRIAAIALVLAAGVETAKAQELEPRAYANLPVALNFLLTGYAYSSGGVLFDPAVPLENAQAQFHGGFIGYIRSLDVAGRSARFQLVVPYAHISASGDLARDCFDTTSLPPN